MPGGSSLGNPRRSPSSREGVSGIARARRRRIWAGFLILLMASSAQAGGFETGFLGPGGLGRGGAFTARADDLTALTWNPAGLAALRKGPAAQVSLGILWGDLRGARSGLDPSTQAAWPEDRNRGGPGPVPVLAAGYPVLDRLVLSAGVLAPSALGRASFDPQGPLRESLVSMDLWLVQYSLGLGWQAHRDLRLGLALEVPHLWRGRLSLGANGWFGDGGPQAGYDVLARLRLSGGAGARVLLGALWRLPVPGLTMGLAVRPFPTRITSSGRLELEYPGAWLSRLERAGRLRITDDRATLDLALPQTLALGIRYAHRVLGVEWFDIEVDGVWEGWSVMDHQTVGLRGGLAIRQDLGPEDVHPFQDLRMDRKWRDGWSVRAGSDWTLLPGRWKARAGLAWESPVVPDGTLRLDFPSTTRWTVGVGTEVVVGRSWRLAVSYGHVASPRRLVQESEVRVAMPLSPCRAPYPEGTCPVSGSPPGPVVGRGTYRMAWDLVTVSVTVAPPVQEARRESAAY